MARIHSLPVLLALAIGFGLLFVGAQLPAQQTAPGPSSPAPQPSQTPDQRAQQPQPQRPGQAPDSQAQSQQPGDQTFEGTIVKSGDKYVLEDAASGNSYDIDPQEQVKKFEGKRVRVRGTLDPSTKTIHITQ
jgi:hypothetical protein